MKNYFLIFVFAISIFSMFIFQGCDESVVDPNPGVTSVNANGTITPTSRTEARGTMFVTDQDGNPISINSSNVTASLNWATDNPVVGTVTITQNSTSGLNISSGMTMDYSGSMGQAQITCMEDAVRAYINAMPNTNIAEIIKFGTTVQVMQTYTNNKTDLLNSVNASPSVGGSTALYQSIFVALNNAAMVNSSQYVRTVVAFTDGGENASSVSRSNMLQASFSSGIPVFTVGLLNNPNSSASLDMQNIADTTGGFYFRVSPDSCGVLVDLYNSINAQLNNSYSITITWPNTGLPPAGTLVNAVIIVTVNSVTAQFTKSYIIP